MELLGGIEAARSESPLRVGKDKESVDLYYVSETFCYSD